MDIEKTIIALQHKLRQIVKPKSARFFARRTAMSVVEVPRAARPKSLYEIGEVPPLGHVPEKMYAWAIRKERHGPPDSAMQIEVLPTWPVGDNEVLVFVMA